MNQCYLHMYLSKKHSKVVKLVAFLCRLCNYKHKKVQKYILHEDGMLLINKNI